MWRKVYPDIEMPNGMFGENFTTQGLLEAGVNIGDVFKIGSSEVIATQPRMPCYKLGVKFGRMDEFLASGRSGIYFKVLEEGRVGAGDSIIQIKKDINRVSISDIVRLFTGDRENIEMMRRAIKVEALPEGLRDYFYELIRRVERKSGQKGISMDENRDEK
jgi:MOSC domain-containing protein YiiM